MEKNDEWSDLVKKEITVIVDSEQARKGLFLHTDKYQNYYHLHKASDEEITNTALEHVGQFAQKFGFELAPQKPVFDTDMEKEVTIKVNTKIARQMLDVAGYNTREMSNEEIFKLAMEMATDYGVYYSERKND